MYLFISATVYIDICWPSSLRDVSVILLVSCIIILHHTNNYMHFGKLTVLLAGLRPVIHILCHFLARGWGPLLRNATRRKSMWNTVPAPESEVIKHDTRFEWPFSILIMTWYPFLPFKTHKTSAKNPRLLTIVGAICFCRYCQCTPSQLWMHAPVAKVRQLMKPQYPIFDRMDNLNPQWMQAVNG